MSPTGSPPGANPPDTKDTPIDNDLQSTLIRSGCVVSSSNRSERKKSLAVNEDGNTHLASSSPTEESPERELPDNDTGVIESEIAEAMTEDINVEIPVKTKGCDDLTENIKNEPSKTESSDATTQSSDVEKEVVSVVDAPVHSTGKARDKVKNFVQQMATGGEVDAEDDELPDMNQVK